MPVVRQRKMAHLIRSMQNGAVLTIGPFGQLDYAMATDVRTISPYILQ